MNEWGALTMRVVTGLRAQPRRKKTDWSSGPRLAGPTGSGPKGDRGRARASSRPESRGGKKPSCPIGVNPCCTMRRNRPTTLRTPSGNRRKPTLEFSRAGKARLDAAQRRNRRTRRATEKNRARECPTPGPAALAAGWEKTGAARTMPHPSAEGPHTPRPF